MQARLTAGRWTIRVGSITTNRIWKHEQRRPVLGKASNRAALHGTKLPKEEAVMEINQGKEKKEMKREEIEKTVDTQLNHPQEPDSPTK